MCRYIGWAEFPSTSSNLTKNQCFVSPLARTSHEIRITFWKRTFSISGEENHERHQKKVNKKKVRRYIECAITMMKLELDMMPTADKRVLIEAQSICCLEESSEERMEAFLFLCALDWHPKGYVSLACLVSFYGQFSTFSWPNPNLTSFLLFSVQQNEREEDIGRSGRKCLVRKSLSFRWHLTEQWKMKYSLFDRKGNFSPPTILWSIWRNDVYCIACLTMTLTSK
jgi:hypothetical protein